MAEIVFSKLPHHRLLHREIKTCRNAVLMPERKRVRLYAQACQQPEAAAATVRQWQKYEYSYTGAQVGFDLGLSRSRDLSITARLGELKQFTGGHRTRWRLAIRSVRRWPPTGKSLSATIFRQVTSIVLRPMQSKWYDGRWYVSYVRWFCACRRIAGCMRTVMLRYRSRRIGRKSMADVMTMTSWAADGRDGVAHGQGRDGGCFVWCWWRMRVNFTRSFRDVPRFDD